MKDKVYPLILWHHESNPQKDGTYNNGEEENTLLMSNYLEIEYHKPPNKVHPKNKLVSNSSIPQDLIHRVDPKFVIHI